MAAAEVQNSRTSTVAANSFSMALCIVASSVVVPIGALPNVCAYMLMRGVMYMARTAVYSSQTDTAG